MSLFSNVIETQTPCDHCLSFIVKGKPQVQKRPKISFHNKKSNVIYYDPSSLDKKNWKKNFSDVLLKNDVKIPVFGSDPLTNKGVHLSMEIFIVRPNNDFTIRKGMKLIKTNPHLYPNVKDLDNMIKFYMDAMQDVAYTNDSVVTKLTCSKDFVMESNCLSTSPEPYMCTSYHMTIRAQ